MSTSCSTVLEVPSSQCESGSMCFVPRGGVLSPSDQWRDSGGMGFMRGRCAGSSSSCSEYAYEKVAKYASGTFPKGTRDCDGVSQCQFVTIEQAKTFCNQESACTAVLKLYVSNNPLCDGGKGCYSPRKGFLMANTTFTDTQKGIGFRKAQGLCFSRSSSCAHTTTTTTGMSTSQQSYYFAPGDSTTSTTSTQSTSTESTTTTTVTTQSTTTTTSTPARTRPPTTTQPTTPTTTTEYTTTTRVLRDLFPEELKNIADRAKREMLRAEAEERTVKRRSAIDRIAEAQAGNPGNVDPVDDGRMIGNGVFKVMVDKGLTNEMDIPAS